MSTGRAETDRLVKDLRKQGFDVVRTGSGHWKVSKPGVSGSVVMAFSPRHTASHRTLTRLKKLGYQR